MLTIEHIRQRLIIWLRLFRPGGSWNIGVVLVFFAINGLVAINAYRHDPDIGYDAVAHLHYIRALSSGRLVTPQDSYEFFSPPLPYLFPAALVAFARLDVLAAAKLAQYLQVLLSIGVTVFLIKTCTLISACPSARFSALLFLGIVPVYYKTFAFVRGEPYVAFFAAVSLYFMTVFVVKQQFSWRNILMFASAMGLGVLSRQWAIFLFPPVFIVMGWQWVRCPTRRSKIITTLGACLVLSLLANGWFYGALHRRYGSVTAFNRSPQPSFSFSNQPPEFYFGLSPRLLFTSPVAPYFPNQLFPILYSEIWGDYWGYFSIYARHAVTAEFLGITTAHQAFEQGVQVPWLDTNYAAMRGYLGRVNLVSIFPSILALVSVLAVVIESLKPGRASILSLAMRESRLLLVLVLIMTMSGYFWFLIRYPNPKTGDTIKATYILHIFPVLAMFVGLFLENVRGRSLGLYRFVIGSLCCSGLHNIAAMLTHY